MPPLLPAELKLGTQNVPWHLGLLLMTTDPSDLVLLTSVPRLHQKGKTNKIDLAMLQSKVFSYYHKVSLHNSPFTVLLPSLCQQHRTGRPWQLSKNQHVALRNGHKVVCSWINLGRNDRLIQLRPRTPDHMLFIVILDASWIYRQWTLRELT